MLANSEKITEALDASRMILNGGEYGSDSSVSDQLGAVRSYLSTIAGYAGEYQELLSRIDEVSYLLGRERRIKE